LTGGADEIAQHGHVGTVRADATGVDGQTETLGKIEIDTRIIQFREAEASSGSDAVHASGINGTRRAMTVPGPACQFVKLFPIAFVPSVHSYALFESVH